MSNLHPELCVRITACPLEHISCTTEKIAVSSMGVYSYVNAVPAVLPLPAFHHEDIRYTELLNYLEELKPTRKSLSGHTALFYFNYSQELRDNLNEIPNQIRGDVKCHSC